MAIIAVVMNKGGVGKTTVATNLAGAAVSRGARVRLYDANPDQGSAYQWSKMRTEAKLSTPNALSAVRVDEDFRAAVHADVPNFDHIIIDTPPNLGTEARCAMSLADLIVIPLRIGQFDTWSLAQTAKVIKDLRALGREVRALAFVNAVPHYVKGELRDSLAVLADMSESFETGPTLIDRQAYRIAARTGLAVTELAIEWADCKAEEEFGKLYAEVFRD